MAHSRLIEKYKSIRKQSYLNTLGNYRAKYAFVGVGHHSISNLYPCLQSLGVPLKFIYSRDLANAKRMATQFEGCTGTSEIDEILESKEVNGIFICTHPAQHFQLLQRAMNRGKNVFIEKPPCDTLAQLDELIKSQKDNVCMAGLQRRFSTVNRLIRRYRLTAKTRSYVYRYVTGSYPEGNAITELFIHPIDNIIQLFGEVTSLQIQAVNHKPGIGFQLLTTHQYDVRGMIELSTGYTWNNCFETLEINTDRQLVYANYPNELKTADKAGTVLGMPLEKVLDRPSIEKTFFNNTGFVPAATQNSLVVQGFYPEIKHFLSLVETGKRDQWSSIASLRPCYATLEQLALSHHERHKNSSH